MSKLFNGFLLNCFYLLLWMIFIAKAISLYLGFILPKSAVFEEGVTNRSIKYVKTEIKRAFGMSYKVKTNSPKIVKKPTLLVKDMILEGVFISKENSFAIIALKNKKNENKIVGKNEFFNGYKLIKIYPKSVILKKNGKLYTLAFKKTNIDDTHIVNIIQEKGSVILKKEEVYKYANNFDKIWKEIKIDDARKNGKWDGFIIKWIKKGSIFSKIGLKKNDKIVKIDDRPLKSYADAFVYYEKIKKRELYLLRLTVIRNNKEKEIEYELF